MLLVHLICWFTVSRGLLVMTCQHRFPTCVLVTSSCWICWQSWYNEKNWVVHFSSNRLSILGRSWSCAVFFNSNEYLRFKQSLRSHRIAVVSSSNCTVTNRSRSWTKTGDYSFICTVSGRGKSRMVFPDLLTIPIVSELKSPCSALCIEASEYTTNVRSSVSLAPSQENQT